MRGIVPAGGAPAAGGTIGVSGAKPAFDLGDALKDGVQQVNQQIQQADQASQDYLVKKTGNLHEVMIMLDQADVSFRYMQQVRNKVLDAYNDVMRMPV